MVHLAIILIVEYIFFLILLRGLSHYSIIYPNLQEGKHFNNTLSKYCSRPGAQFLMFCRILIFIYLCYSIIFTYFIGKSEEWNSYSTFIKFLGTFFFFMVSILSVRKVYYCRLPDVTYPLLDPRMTAMVNDIFNLLVPIAFVSSAMSVFVHREIVYEDHAVTLFCFFEMFLNTIRVGGGEIFLCISFALLYIGFVWVTSAFLEIKEWPHNKFKMKTKWCALNYNVFIFAHLVSFVFYYVLMKYVCFTSLPEAKVVPKDSNDNKNDHDNDIFSTLPNSDNGDEKENTVEVIHPNNSSDGVGDSGGADNNLMIQDIESNGGPPLEPVFDPQAKKLADEKEAALVAQMIAERTEKKKIFNVAKELKLQVQELKEQNAREHHKLEKVVGRLSERDLQLKELESWLSAKNDEELAVIKMQMADKLNDMSHFQRPKSARGGEVDLGHTSALLDMDAKAPVQTKNLQALSALRKMKEKKFAKFDQHDNDDNTADTNEHGKDTTSNNKNTSSFNMYKTL